MALRERDQNFLQKCLFSKKYLEACTSSDTKHTSIPKALQFILRALDRDSDLKRDSAVSKMCHGGISHVFFRATSISKENGTMLKQKTSRY